MRTSPIEAMQASDNRALGRGILKRFGSQVMAMCDFHSIVFSLLCSHSVVQFVPFEIGMVTLHHCSLDLHNLWVYLAQLFTFALRRNFELLNSTETVKIEDS